MNKWIFFSAAGLTFVLSACGPQLKVEQYPEADREWVAYMKTAYPDWKAAQPVSMGMDLPVNTVNQYPHHEQITKPVNYTNVPAQRVEPQTIVPADTPTVEGNFEEIQDDIIFAKVDPVETLLKPGVEKTPVIAAAPKGDVLGTYKVKNGDNFWRIAVKFYGKGNYYTHFVKANSQIANPNALKPGTVINVPAIKGITMKTNVDGFTAAQGLVKADPAPNPASPVTEIETIHVTPDTPSTPAVTPATSDTPVAPAAPTDVIETVEPIENPA